MHKIMRLIVKGVVVVSPALIAAQSHPRLELSPAYRRWLNEDVRWMITTRERQRFMSLTSDLDRDEFVANFWKRRNPKPESGSNEYKDEHYRRLAFANDHFAASIAGFMTDRGRIYIVHGPPDSIEVQEATSSAPAGASVAVSPHERRRRGSAIGIRR